MTQSDAAVIGRDLLVAVLDRIIPAGDGFPSAGEIASDYVARRRSIGRCRRSALCGDRGKPACAIAATDSQAFQTPNGTAC